MCFTSSYKKKKIHKAFCMNCPFLTSRLCYHFFFVVCQILSCVPFLRWEMMSQNNMNMTKRWKDNVCICVIYSREWYNILALIGQQNSFDYIYTLTRIPFILLLFQKYTKIIKVSERGLGERRQHLFPLTFMTVRYTQCKEKKKRKNIEV